MQEVLTGSKRIESVDILRGIIIVIMGLDHVRDYFALTPFSPEDISQTTPLWFFTRWITHYCAPGFVFLAGVSACLYGKKVSRDQLRNFLISRGFWLILIEFTFVHLGWTFSLTVFYFVQVIWVIGWSMIVLALLIYLPRQVILGFTLLVILGHNLLDGISINNYWWQLLHQPRWEPPLYVAYPLIPWPAVMSFGYLVGELFIASEQARRRKLVILGLLLIAGFLILRVTNVYGDASHWSVQERGWVYTILSFLNTTKYPPSLLYLCMTLGPLIILLAFLERIPKTIGKVFQVFGRVPFFYYILHIYVCHLLAILYHGLKYGVWQRWFFFTIDVFPEDYTASLVTTYVAWFVLTVIMYFLCRWFGRVKSTYPYWWLKYL